MKKKILLLSLFIHCKSHGMDLYQAAEANDLVKVKEFIAAGVDLDEVTRKTSTTPLGTMNEGLTPLNQAAYLWNNQSAVTLIENGANLDAGDADGGSQPALYLAMLSRNYTLATLLIETGVDVDKVVHNRYTLLQHAKSSGKNIVKKMLQHNVHIKDKNPPSEDKGFQKDFQTAYRIDCLIKKIYLSDEAESVDE